MLLGRVIGTVWATRKDEKLEGMRLLIVQEVDLKLEPQGGFVVAVDSVQSGVGEIVLVARGSSARQTRITKDTPVDAVIMASVDSKSFAMSGDVGRDSFKRMIIIVGDLFCCQVVMFSRWCAERIAELKRMLA